MLSSEFTPEMGALIRRLETRIRNQPNLRHEDVPAALASIEESIVILCALHMKLTKEAR